MRKINNYIVEKLKLNKDTKDVSGINILNQVFDTTEELVEALNDYFDDKLIKPIKVIKTEARFKPIGPFTKDGIYVQDHFEIRLKGTEPKLRFGFHRNYGLMSQFMFKDYKGSTMYGSMRKYDAYKLGKENFLEWLLAADKNVIAPTKRFFGINEKDK